jgi:membrane protease YdiL (CAAX protease family)
MGFKRQDYFLAKGQLDAPAEKVRWLGMKEDEPWTKFGRSFAIVISIVLIIFLVLGTRPTPQQLLTGLPFLPFAVIFAAMNAFSEELTYRSALLTPLHGVLGKQNALWVTSLLFGLGHFYGVPYGWVGVAMASFLAYILGKSLLETRGFFWAWFIHSLEDVIIFTPMAIGLVVAGGG